ncbi:hypothetical protein ACMYSQ_000663 [Aspergillus niger]
MLGGEVKGRKRRRRRWDVVTAGEFARFLSVSCARPNHTYIHTYGVHPIHTYGLSVTYGQAASLTVSPLALPTLSYFVPSFLNFIRRLIGCYPSQLPPSPNPSPPLLLLIPPLPP